MEWVFHGRFAYLMNNSTILQVTLNTIRSLAYRFIWGGEVAWGSMVYSREEWGWSKGFSGGTDGGNGEESGQGLFNLKKLDKKKIFLPCGHVGSMICFLICKEELSKTMVFLRLKNGFLD